MEISDFSPDELARLIKTYVVNADGASVEDVGERLAVNLIAESLPSGTMGFLTSKLWHDFKREMRLFICTNDTKYADLRKVFGTTKSQAAAISLVAASLGSRLGVAGATGFPFCALILYAVARVGKNALCKGEDLDVPIESGKPPKKKSRKSRS